MNSVIRKNVDLILQKRRAGAEQEAKQTKSAIYAACPELAQLDALMNGVQVRKSYLRLNKAMPERIVATMQALSPELVRADVAALDRALERMLARRKQLLQEL